MHYLHTLVWLIERLTRGDPVAWALFIGAIILVGIGVVYDLRRGKRKDLHPSKRGDVKASTVPQGVVRPARIPSRPDLPTTRDTGDSAS
jgi:hypothetical protein